MKLNKHNPQCVEFSKSDVQAFKSQWPCSGLRDRGYWFVFDSCGNLADTNAGERDDGAAAVALSQDAQAFLETGKRPEWLAR